jgi:hypothetical protein
MQQLQLHSYLLLCLTLLFVLTCCSLEGAAAVLQDDMTYFGDEDVRVWRGEKHDYTNATMLIASALGTTLEYSKTRTIIGTECESGKNAICLRQAIRRVGLEANFIQLSVDDLRALSEPVILFLEEDANHIAIVIYVPGHSERACLIVPGEMVTRFMSWGDLSRYWSGVAMTVKQKTWIPPDYVLISSLYLICRALSHSYIGSSSFRWCTSLLRSASTYCLRSISVARR